MTTTPRNTRIFQGKLIDTTDIGIVLRPGELSTDLNSLTLYVHDGVTPGGVPLSHGAQGPAGLSAYQIAVQNGFNGTEAQWLASLVGPQGPAGAQGTGGSGTGTNFSGYVTSSTEFVIATDYLGQQSGLLGHILSIPLNTLNQEIQPGWEVIFADGVTTATVNSVYTNGDHISLNLNVPGGSIFVQPAYPITVIGTVTLGATATNVVIPGYGLVLNSDGTLSVNSATIQGLLPVYEISGNPGITTIDNNLQVMGVVAATALTVSNAIIFPDGTVQTTAALSGSLGFGLQRNGDGTISVNSTTIQTLLPILEITQNSTATTVIDNNTIIQGVLGAHALTVTNAIYFPDGTSMTTAAFGSGGGGTGTYIVNANLSQLAPGAMYFEQTSDTVSIGQLAAQSITVGSSGIQIAGTGGVQIMGAAGAAVDLGGGSSGSIVFNSPTVGINYNDLSNLPNIGSLTTSTLYAGTYTTVLATDGTLTTPGNVITSGTVFAQGLSTTGQLILPNIGQAGGIVSANGQGNIYYNTDNSLVFIVTGTYQTSFNADGTTQLGGGYIFPNVPGTQGQVLVYDPAGNGDYTLRWQNGGSVVQSATAPTANTSTIWYDTVSGRSYVYFDSAWVDANPVPTPASTSTIVNGTYTLAVSTTGGILLAGNTNGFDNISLFSDNPYVVTPIMNLDAAGGVQMGFQTGYFFAGTATIQWQLAGGAQTVSNVSFDTVTNLDSYPAFYPAITYNTATNTTADLGVTSSMSTITNFGSWRNLNLTGHVRFGDGSQQTTAFTATSYIDKATLKSIVAASTSFTDFQARIAAL